MARTLIGRTESIAGLGKKSLIALLILYCVILVSLVVQIAAAFMYAPVIWPLLVMVAAFVITAAIALRHERLSRKEVYRYCMYWATARKQERG